MDRILVRATNWVGDAVMSLPALQTLRSRFPSARIAVLARPWVAGLYAREPFADEVIPYESARGWKDIKGKLRVAGELRGRFDAAILLQNAFEAAAVVWLARIPRRIGYNRDGRGFLLTDAIAVPKPGEIPEHQQHYYTELLRRAGIIDKRPLSDTIRLTGADAARQAGIERFRQLGYSEPLVGVSPGAAYGTAKRWIPERFAQAAAQLGGPVALFGSRDEFELCKSVAAALATQGCSVINLAGKTSLPEFIDLAAACRVFLTNDSGAMHISSALGVPTVAIFGATDHVATGPTGPLARIVREPVECSPCLLRECPIDHRCMTRISAGRVASIAEELLDKTEPRV